MEKIIGPEKLQRYYRREIANLPHPIEHLSSSDLFFVSSKTGSGMSPLIKFLKNEGKRRKAQNIRREIFIIGNINSGKSTFVQYLHNNLKKYNQKFIHDPFDKMIKKGIEQIKTSSNLSIDQKIELTSSIVPQTTLDMRKVQIPNIGKPIFLHN